MLLVTTTKMHWHQEEEKRLRDLLGSGTSLEEVAQLLNRSPEAIVLKVKRSGLRIPSSWLAKRKTTRGAFQALTWIRELLTDVRTPKDLERLRGQVDQALDRVKTMAATDFQNSLDGA